ncbi:carbohydrate ABC transporter permease [Pontibacillus litoralis]|uniref:Sugar ABC transporter permease n=1 Tax=Pontibacillus litoralis JSM 072002 TaxID=1385512 RepID=A0A0A5G3Z9_9BACI|nr:carbohydrate ABC transporter permease [Pontibacillus litoralis]KGX85863.1 sugar ABC transporter permease [Pontibacillus litoralis JSM 072002]
MYDQHDKTLRFFRVFNMIIIVLLCLTIILPFLNILALSFNDGADAQRGGIYFLPREFSLENYIEVFQQSTIINAFGITLFRTVLGTIFSVFLTAMAAYALKTKTLPGRKVITFFIFFTMLFSGGVVPYYLVLNELQLTNTIWVYIIPSLYSVWNILIMRTFFQQIPESLEEAARIDGCSEFQIFIRIILPMSKPVIATIGLFNAVAHWNDWFSGSFYVRNSELKPLATLLQEMLTSQQALSEALLQNSGAYAALDKITVTGDSLKMATIILVVAPILMVYPFIQKYFVKGVNIGSVKE